MARRKSLDDLDEREQEMAHRVREVLADGEDAVVKNRNGRPGKVYHRSKYEKMQAQPAKHKPWQQRQANAVPPDPLGAIDAEPPQPLTRESLYEE